MPDQSTPRLDALDKFEERKKLSATIVKVDNSSLPAGAPMYYYCRLCGALSAILPEEHLSPPPKLCEDCRLMNELGWL